MRNGIGGKLQAWSVHILTASGAVFTLLALQAIHQERWQSALLWLFVALLVDGIDGTLARAAQVKTRLPGIDGEALDLIVDYLNYVLVPTIFMWRAGLLPTGWEIALAAAILLSSLYVFVRRDMKTEDGYFRGFPALWNVAAFYLYVIDPGPGAAAGVVVVLVAATFAPIHFVHPFRVEDYGRYLAPIAILWGISTAALLVLAPAAVLAAILLNISLLSGAVLVGLGLWRTFRSGEPDPRR